MARRGNRFAKGRPARQDADGRALPSDLFTRYVAVELVCSVCAKHGKDTVLGTWAVDSTAPEFRPADVYALGTNRAVEQQVIRDGEGVRTRFCLLCPRCGNAPQFREEAIDRALEAIYEQGAQMKVRRIPV